VNFIYSIRRTLKRVYLDLDCDDLSRFELNTLKGFRFIELSDMRALYVLLQWSCVSRASFLLTITRRIV